jgi:uncharacterized UPF0160 family protein
MNDLIRDLHYVKTIATHDDVFHADEVLAIAAFRLIKGDVKVVRTREENVVANADMRVDIGKKYDIDTFDFDHHQRGGAGKRANGVPYASAGLIWKTFGNFLVSEHDTFTYLDHKIFQPIDAEDNGMSIYNIKVKKPFTLFDVISSYNILWQERAHAQYMSQDEAFNMAVDMTKQIFINEWMKAKRIPEYNSAVKSAIAKYSGKDYLILEKDIPIWQPTVVRKTDMKYVIHPDENWHWRSRAVPKKINGFESRLPFPEEWRGLSGKELQEITQIYDAEFCHKAGFMAVAKTKEGAIALTERSLGYQR